MTMFVRVVEAGGFTAAAKALRAPVSTVSRHIADLEAHLGAKLLVRTTRNMALTEVGGAYLASAKRILEEVDAAESAAAGDFASPKGELVVTAPVMFGRLHILPVVAEFLALNPLIAVRMVFQDRNLHLIDDHVDLAVRIGQLPDSGLVATRVGTMRQVTCVAPSVLAAHGAPRHPADLQALPSISFDHEGGATGWTYLSPKGGATINARLLPRLTVSSADAAVWAAEQGLGVTRVFAYQCHDAVEAGRLRLVLESFEPEPTPITLLHAQQGRIPLKLRAFLDFATPRLRARLQRLAAQPGEGPDV